MAKKAADEASGTAEKITQKEAVRRAIEAKKDQPKEGVAWIKETFSMDLSPGAFSTLKTLLKSANKPSGKKRGRPARTIPTARPTTIGNGKANPVDLARGVKALVDQFGADAVRDMTGVFAD